MGINWNYPTTIWLGKDRVNDIELACAQLKIKNPLFAVLEFMAVPAIDPLLELKYPQDPSLDQTHGHIPETSSIDHVDGNPFPKSSDHIVSPVFG